MDPVINLDTEMTPSSSRPPRLTPVRFYMAAGDDYDDEEYQGSPRSPGAEAPPPCRRQEIPRPTSPGPMSPRAWKAASAAAAALEPEEEPEPSEDSDFFEPYPYNYDELYPKRDPMGPYQMGQAKIAAEDALRHYNADPGSKVRYDQVTRIADYSMMFHYKGGYCHVNFFARRAARGHDEDGSTEEEEEDQGAERFFFAEVHRRVPTCLCSLDAEGDDQVGGVGGDPFARAKDWLVPVDFCVKCTDKMKHPKDGASYHAGHLYPVSFYRKPGSVSLD